MHPFSFLVSCSLRHQTGYWTNYGMKVIKTNDTTTICASSHIEMSSFAVIMEPYYDPVCIYVNILSYHYVLI